MNATKPTPPAPRPALSAHADRRRFLAGLIAGGATVGSLPRTAAADLGCTEVWAGRLCTVGIPSSMLHVPAPQAKSQWCWAASIAMVFRFHGHAVSQQRIVEECYGSAVDMPAHPALILAALNRTWVDDAGDPFHVDSDWGHAALDETARDLADDQPLILGTMGHAMVLTAMTYLFRWVPSPSGPTLGPPQLRQVVVRDPWPGRGRRELSFTEVVKTLLCARIRIT